MTPDYKLAMRQLLAEKAEPMSDPEYPSTYGWQDFDALTHCRSWTGGGGCSWVLPTEATVHERTLTMFAGTFVDSEEEVGIEVAGVRCACGKYTDVTLRYTGSMQDTLEYLLGVQVRGPGLEI